MARKLINQYLMSNAWLGILHDRLGNHKHMLNYFSHLAKFKVEVNDSCFSKFDLRLTLHSKAPPLLLRVDNLLDFRGHSFSDHRLTLVFIRNPPNS